MATVAALIGGLGAFCGAITNVLVYPNLRRRGDGTPDTRPAASGFRRVPRPGRGEPSPAGIRESVLGTTRTSHDLAEARLAEVTVPALVVMGEQDPDFRDPRAEGDWVARALRAQVVMVPEAGHYPQSQRPGITTGAVLRFLESVRAVPRAGRRAAVLPGVGATAWGYCP